MTLGGGSKVMSRCPKIVWKCHLNHQWIIALSCDVCMHTCSYTSCSNIICTSMFACLFMIHMTAIVTCLCIEGDIILLTCHRLSLLDMLVLAGLEVNSPGWNTLLPWLVHLRFKMPNSNRLIIQDLYKYCGLWMVKETKAVLPINILWPEFIVFSGSVRKVNIKQPDIESRGWEMVESGERKCDVCIF